MAKLPPIRADIKIDSSEIWLNGQNTYLITDPLSSNYYRIDQKTLVIMQHWHLGDSEKVYIALQEKKLNSITPEDIENTLKFLSSNSLISTQNPDDIARLSSKKKTKPRNWINSIIHNYLYFQINLIHPQKFLDATIPIVSKCFNKKYLLLLFIIFGIGLYLSLQNWQEFFEPLDKLFSIQGIIYLFIGMSIVKIIHELGHAYAVTYYGCRVHSMGVAFIVMFPVLFTDATDAWRLHEPRKRVIIDCAGMIAEINLMIWLLLFWHLIDSAIIKTVITYALTYGLISTLMINLNPVMRFDGYYAFSNFINIDNLQSRGFTLARWRLRKLLLGVDEPIPVQIPHKKMNLMLFYSYFTWFYRFFLFLGIAFLVYHLFFKLLGIILFVIEIFYFIISPILSELIVYGKHLKNQKINKNIIISSLSLVLLFLLLILPWQNTLVIPAVLVFSEKKDFYIEQDCYATKLLSKNKLALSPGDLLFACEAIDLTEQKKLIALRIKAIEVALHQQGMGQKVGYKQTDQEEIDALTEQYNNIVDREQRLVIKAPFAGNVINIQPTTTINRWYSTDTMVLSLVNPNHWIVKAYLPEIDLYRLDEISNPYFLSNSTSTPAIKLTLANRPLTRANELDNFYLSTNYGGHLSTYPSTDKKGPLSLKDNVFPFVFNVLENQDINFEQRGVVIMKVARQSLIKRFYLHVISILVKESTF